jgi:hypothetical protein
MLFARNRRVMVRIGRGAIWYCGGTPHSCDSEPARFNILPDKSGVPAETMRLNFLQYQGVPKKESRANTSLTLDPRHSTLDPCWMTPLLQ